MCRLPSLVLFSCLMLAPAAGLRADEFKLEPGFTLLFNGKNLDGWKEASGKKEPLDGKTEAYNGRFKVVDGRLVYDPAVKGDLHIETAQGVRQGRPHQVRLQTRPQVQQRPVSRGTKFDIIPGNKENKNVKEGEWYTFEIVVTGDKIEHKINGAVVRTVQGQGRPRRRSSLRAEFGAMEIKNIRAKE